MSTRLEFGPRWAYLSWAHLPSAAPSPAMHEDERSVSGPLRLPLIISDRVPADVFPVLFRINWEADPELVSEDLSVGDP